MVLQPGRLAAGWCQPGGQYRHCQQGKFKRRRGRHAVGLQHNRRCPVHLQVGRDKLSRNPAVFHTRHLKSGIRHFSDMIAH